jgi:hypothetical protein
MEDLFRSYWWLLFPVMFFVFGAWDRWLAYRRSQDRLDLLRTYSTQGKDPPPELVKAIRDDELDDEDDDFRGRRPGRYYRRRWRYSNVGMWSRALTMGAIALGFWLASEYGGIAGVETPFRIVAIILTCIAVGQAAVALMFMTMKGR